MSSERLCDFSASWCQDLLKSTELINTSTTTRRPEPPADRVVTNTLFSETLKSDTSIRAWQSLQAKKTDTPNASPTFFLLLSLGNGLNSYKGILHGGMLGCIMDQAASMCAIGTAGPTMVTAEMTVRYKKTVTLPAVVLCRTVAVKKESGKLWVHGVIETEPGAENFEAKSLFSTEKHGRL